MFTEDFQIEINYLTIFITIYLFNPKMKLKDAKSSNVKRKSDLIIQKIEDFNYTSSLECIENVTLMSKRDFIIFQ